MPLSAWKPSAFGTRPPRRCIPCLLP